MRRNICILLICCLTLMMFSPLSLLNAVNEVSAAEDGMHEIINFESIIRDYGSSALGKGGYTYEDDPTEGIILSAPDGDATLFLPDTVDASYYTIHIEMAVKEVVVGTVIGNAILLGSENDQTMFYVKDIDRSTATNRPAYVRLNQKVSGTSTTIVEHQTCDNLKFNANEWFDIDIVIDTNTSRVTVFVNGVQELTKGNLTDLALSGQIGFFAKKAKFRNFSVSVKELYSFESLQSSSGALSLIGEADASYANGILTMQNAANRSVILSGAKVADLQKFTLHTELKLPAYSNNVLEFGIGVGTTQGDLSRFILKDDGTERSSENLRTAYLARLISGGAADGVTALDFNLVPETWIKIDLLIDATKEADNVDVYINNRFVTTYSLATSLMTNAKVGFRGFQGVAFRNFSVLEYLAVPVAEGFTSAQVELNEKIDVIFNARVPKSETNLSAEILFDGDIISLDVSDLVVRADADGYNTVAFALKDICPQDICKSITVKLYSNGVLLTQLDDYSIQSYCLRLLPNKTRAGTNEDLIDLRKMLLSILNYGSYAQKFFTEDTVFANDGVSQADFKHYDMSTAQSVRSISTKERNDYYWQSATLALYNTICLRFKFVATDIQNVTVKAVVNGNSIQEYAAEDFVVLNEDAHLYYVDFSEILANQFNDAVDMELWVDGNKVQTVTYSVNSFIQAYFASGKTESDASYNLVQAIYDYGCVAQAYGG